METKPKKQTPMRNGIWHSNGMKTTIFLVKGEQIHAKLLVALDYPEETNSMYDGKVLYGDFGPAHKDIVRTTGIANYNCELQFGAMWKVHCVLNEEGTRYYSIGNFLCQNFPTFFNISLNF